MTSWLRSSASSCNQTPHHLPASAGEFMRCSPVTAAFGMLNPISPSSARHRPDSSASGHHAASAGWEPARSASRRANRQNIRTPVLGRAPIAPPSLFLLQTTATRATQGRCGRASVRLTAVMPTEKPRLRRSRTPCERRADFPISPSDRESRCPHLPDPWSSASGWSA